ncbi:MAG: hypothetical protein R3C45_13345 [Phycisphaerales bacterium]
MIAPQAHREYRRWQRVGPDVIDLADELDTGVVAQPADFSPAFLPIDLPLRLGLAFTQSARLCGRTMPHGVGVGLKSSRLQNTSEHDSGVVLAG